MCRSRLIVLKFGGSVLTDELTLRLAVHEIYRWRRENWRVVAVVSALAGVTDGLFQRYQRLNGRAPPSSMAAVVSTGEVQCAAFLLLHLNRAGVPASVLTPGAFGLVAEGPALDAAPVDLDVRPLLSALARDGVTVVPGYVAQDAGGRPCLLGRGGSDLTAIYLAHRLKADCCRLIKDVDGLYDRDPSQPGPAPRRYATASWADALATDGSIVQHKAVRFAAQHAIEFELSRINGRKPTRIGRGPTTFWPGGEPRRRLRTVLLGHGVVGGGVYDLLRQLEPFVEIVRVAVRDCEKHRLQGVPGEILTTDPMAAGVEGIDLVIEALGGIEIAGRALTAALNSGAHVVTANKALLAQRGECLRALARAHGCLLRCSAAVGGSMPLLERLYGRRGRGVRSIRAVLNGTTNVVIDRMVGGMNFADAVREAQVLGFAEADPLLDLSGKDAADKLTVVADTIGAAHITSKQVHTDPLTVDTIGAALNSRRDGEVFRHVASLDYPGGKAAAAVRLCELDADDPLAGVQAEENAAVIEWSDGETELLRGKGAGRWPTAEAAIADVLEIARVLSADNTREPRSSPRVSAAW